MANHLRLNATQVQKTLDLYLQGKSASFLAGLFSCSVHTILKTLKRHGVKTRNKREAFQAMSQEERLAFTAEAHAAKRGKPEPLHSKCKRAITIEGKGKITILEGILLKLLQERITDLKFIPQKACGPYNIDIALTKSRIAVEVFSSGHHTSGPAARRYQQRLKYLLDAGWIPVIVWVHGSRPITSVAADYIVTLHQKLRWEEPVICKEHVIWGTGEVIPIDQRDPDTGAGIKRLRRTNHTRRGDDCLRQ